MRKVKLLFFIFITPLIITVCTSMKEPGDWEADIDKVEPPERREERLLGMYSRENKEKYNSRLVPIRRYSTGGVVYHEKYHRHLISIAADLVENKALEVMESSIGFYYDRTSRNKERLYLGLDIDAGINLPPDFRRAVEERIRSDLNDVIETVNSCASVFENQSIAGFVVGWAWGRGSSDDPVSIWILKEDLSKFDADRITFEELVLRSTITDTKGRIIRLAI